jgi:hypothetical protein
MKNIINKIAKLIDVKSLVTLTLTGVVAYLAIIGRIDIENIYLMIIAFYFGTQVQKKANEDNNGEG